MVEKSDSKEVLQDVLKTGIPGFDELFFTGGIPKRSTIIVAGGAGTGKSIFCRQICYNLISRGKQCMYVSFEESIPRIERSMLSFGWDISKHIKGGRFLIQKIDPLDILRMKFGSISGTGTATEITAKIQPLIIPRGFSPEVIVVDSLSAVIAATVSKAKNYRVYLHQLFSFFEESGATSFLITETEQIPEKYSSMGIEEFLADGVVVLYNVKKGNVRENAMEVLKMRCARHQKKIVHFEITEKGIVVHPDIQVSIE
jgi:circadian clock protein KaiC